MQNIKELEEKRDTLAMELLGAMKKIISLQWLLILILVALLAGTNIYHIWQWSQFDTIVADSGEGSGGANYIGNDGDINNYGENNGEE